MAMNGRKSALVVLLCFNWVIGIVVARGIEDYWSKRANLIHAEKKIAFGGDISLTKNEMLTNRTLMSAKLKEIQEGFSDPNKFFPRANFLTVKNKIEKSKVFQIIKKMPKGALLHAHDLGTVSHEFVLRNLTYRSDLYVCQSEGGLKLMFFKTPGKNCHWELLSELRNTPAKEIQINKRILEEMTMMTDNPAKAYPDGDAAWAKFQSLFSFLFPFITYKPVFEDYFNQLLQEIYDDKVLYLELRTVLPDIFDLSGRVYKSLEVMQILNSLSQKFVAEHPDFLGIKIIYAPMRHLNQNELKKHIENAELIKESFPEFLAGFDLVGHEEKGGTLREFAEQLQVLGQKMPFFFHAGETDWYGLSTDENLIDAVLLNAKRIGHGYALLKHPKVMEIVLEEKIAIEVNPISNQVLNLVDDLRNHPASILFAENYPVVVSSDDPGLWGAKALSYDFYEAFMGLMSGSSDLRALKKLAINSLLYSTMSDKEQSKAIQIFQKQWEDFLLDVAEMENKEFRLSNNSVD
ncbi:adenosine deaminase 2-like [Belonocnema kinseyi]|uniref:adenosine deaminase 2-like n=1 Tax=Belonocnema kinseyi TaxID=2817044 RepID=UPI00143CC5C2|nr:adenosine deaminase 2-like [Belonocnema kinseyi]